MCPVDARHLCRAAGLFGAADCVLTSRTVRHAVVDAHMTRDHGWAWFAQQSMLHWRLECNMLVWRIRVQSVPVPPAA